MVKKWDNDRRNFSKPPSTKTQKGQTWTVKLRVMMARIGQLGMKHLSLSRIPRLSRLNNSPPNDVFTTDSILVDYTYTDYDGDESNNPAIIWSKNGVQQSALDGLNPLPAEYTTKGIYGLFRFKPTMGNR